MAFCCAAHALPEAFPLVLLVKRVVDVEVADGLGLLRLGLSHGYARGEEEDERQKGAVAEAKETRDQPSCVSTQSHCSVNHPLFSLATSIDRLRMRDLLLKLTLTSGGRKGCRKEDSRGKR